MNHKFKIERMETSNQNDCWAIALSKALDEDYDKVYRRFKHFHSGNGVEADIIEGYLRHKGYFIVTTKMELMNAIRVYDNKTGIIFAMEDQEGGRHIVYIKENIIYEGTELDDDMLFWYIKEYKLLFIAKKLNGFD